VWNFNQFARVAEYKRILAGYNRGCTMYDLIKYPSGVFEKLKRMLRKNKKLKRRTPLIIFLLLLFCIYRSSIIA
jgi:hypothetical protein